VSFGDDFSKHKIIIKIFNFNKLGLYVYIFLDLCYPNFTILKKVVNYVSGIEG
jgi:hypothetical protein